ncbi:MFS transporter [Nocardia nova]|uniref:MFS transporter n=1 Tax=Nocardia nova TaxID=37330 RepID=A0A2S6AUC7_9NOCA|nr:MFS transporter [Nocardia nova]PPJ38788.1 MFS transporter [Nocardia nova]
METDESGAKSRRFRYGLPWEQGLVKRSVIWQAEAVTSPPDIPAATSDPASDKLDAAVFKVAGVVVLGAIMSILDVTVVTVALPTFQHEFDTSYAIAAWTMTGYTLALASVIPLTGWAADRFGTKRLYILALTFFILGSVLCSTAWNIESLIAFRVVQGLGGGMLMPLGMTIMTHAAGPQRIGRVMAVLGVPMLLGPILGPILGGWLIGSFSWHWIFLINLPVGVVALILAVVVLPPDRPEPSESFDFLGMLLASPGLALFLFGVSSIPEQHTVASARVLVPAAIGLVLMVGFVFHALRTEHPLIDLHLFRNRQLTVAVLTAVFFAVAFFGSSLLLPSYLQQVQGKSTLATGLLIAPQGLGAMVTMPIGGKLVDKIGPGKVVMSGLAVIAVSMLFFTQLSADTSLPLMCVALFVMGLGMGCTMMPTMTAAIQTLTHAQVARGSTLMNIVNQAAGSIGTATMSVLLTNMLENKPLAQAAIGSRFDPTAAQKVPPEQLDAGFDQAATAYAHTYIVALVLVVVTLIPAVFLPRSKPKLPQEGTDAPVLMGH